MKIGLFRLDSKTTLFEVFVIFIRPPSLGFFGMTFSE